MPEERAEDEVITRARHEQTGEDREAADPNVCRPPIGKRPLDRTRRRPRIAEALEAGKQHRPHHLLGAEAVRGDHDARDGDAGTPLQSCHALERLREQRQRLPIRTRAVQLFTHMVVSVHEEGQHVPVLPKETGNSRVRRARRRAGSWPKATW